MTHKPYEPVDAIGPTDEHRFASEPTRRGGGRKLAFVFGGLALVMAVLGVGGWVAKGSWEKYSAERAEKQKQEKAKSPEAGRRAKTFGDAPAAAASAPALPAGFGQVKPPPGQVPPIPLADVPQGGDGIKPAAIPKAPTMMLADAETAAGAQEVRPIAPLPSPPGRAAAAAPVTPAALPFAPATVQDMARIAAGKSTSVSSTNQSTAARLGDRSLLLARGAFVPCVLETDLNSNVPGPASCISTGNVFSDDGKVVLIEKGSRILGEYRATLKQGDERIAVLWSRIKTPNGVVVDVDSPAGDGTGAVGVEGTIDNHWMKRIGAAFMLSLVQDVVAAKTSGDQGGGTTINTYNSTKSMSEKVLESTINIPPTLYRNRGERLMVLVNRDLWFDSVYALEKRRK